MINWIATSSVLILVVIMLRYLLCGRIALRLQYALWLIVLVRLLLPLEIGSSEIALSNAVEQAPIVREFTDLQQFTSIEREESGAVVGYTTPDKAAPPVQIADNKTTDEFARMTNALKLRDIASMVWKAGAAVFLAVLLAVNLSLSRRLRKNRTELKQLELLTVYITDQVETPCLFGLFGPAVYVTPEAAADETVLRHTIEHELTHYRHGDHIWALLRCLALALHWYNPLVWWAAKLARDDGELACDESTLLRLGESERADYGRTLIGMTCKGRSQLLTTATTMTGSQNTLKERIGLIAKKPKMAVYTLIAVVLVAAVTVVFTFTGSSPAKNRKLHEWMQSVTAEDLSYAYISEGFGTEATSYTLSEDYRAQLVSILNGIEWSQLEMDQIGGTSERRLFVATGEYLDWEEEFIFGCCDDGRIFISFTSEFGEELSAPSKGWYVTSPELLSFINDILDGKSGLEEDSGFFRADFDGDGENERITVAPSEIDEIYTLQVIDTDGAVLLSKDAALVHQGWTIYMLYDNGYTPGILQYTPYANMGLAGYTYELFYLDGREIRFKGGVSFPLDENSPPPGGIETDPDEVVAFLEEINELMEYSTIILSTQDGELIVGPESPQKYIDDNMELIRRFGGGEAQPYDVAEEMKRVKASDITQLFNFDLTADQIAPALNGAADNVISASEASARGFGSHTMNFWSEKAYLGGSYETAVGGLNVSFDMECGLVENIVKVSFGKGNVYSTAYFDDEALYNLLRYRGCDRTGEIDREAFEKYSDILTPTMEANLEAFYDSQPVYDYELVEFHKAGSYTEADGATITVYDFDFGLLTWNPNDIGFAGGLYVDGYGRLRGINVGQLAVRHRSGKMAAHAFLGNDFYYSDQYVMDSPESEEFIKEHLKNTLDFAENRYADSTTPQELTANAASFPTEQLELVFASGAGAWGTYLTLNPDGSFTGDYGDSDADTRYTCKFEGRFTNTQQVNDYCWAMELEDIDIEKKEGTTWTENGIHYIAAGPHGISGGSTFILYAPGTPADELPAACREWWPDAYNWRNGEQDSLDGWALYNLDTGHGFFTSWLS